VTYRKVLSQYLTLLTEDNCETPQSV